MAQEPAAKAKGPLDGLRVVDWTVWQQGPVSSAMLGDLGAEVIKIEERQFGDGGRSIFAFEGVPTSSYFETNNRNKRSIALDIKTPDGLNIVRELVARSDIFVHNFRPGVPEKVGLGYDDLREINPRLIYGEASAFGSKGPDASGRGHDLLGIARSGIMMATDSSEPKYMPGAMGDQMGASMLAYGVLAAVVARERFGVGQKVESSLLGGMVWLQGIRVALQLMQGVSMGSDDRAPGNPLYRCYRCGDGKWLALATPQADRHWPELVEALGRPELATDIRFGDHLSRGQNEQACVEQLSAIFATQPRAEWFRKLSERGTVPFGPVNTMADLVHDPQVIANGYITSFDHPEAGTLRMPGFPINLSETPPSVRRRAPEFGEHTEEILISILGKNWDDITQLRELKVI